MLAHSSKTIYDFLMEARERPRMYFRSPQEIESICSGYYAALDLHDIHEDVPVLDQRHFGEWLRRKFNWPMNCGWAAALRDNFNSDDEAFDRFFELIDEYRRLQPKLIGQVWRSSKHKPTDYVNYPLFTHSNCPLPPREFQLFQYFPDAFYFFHFDGRINGFGASFESPEIALAWLEKKYQVKPEEWSLS